MTAVIRPEQGRMLPLPGRTATELVSAAEGGHDVTVRRVVIPPERPSVTPRGPHVHPDCTEVMLVLAGSGEFTAGDRSWPAGPGDVIVVSPGQPHRTRNTGPDDLVLCCVFPVPELVTVEDPP
ncbi:MAG: cupin domain-containing protein [Streptosporangiaceae bacterium]|nr:cupin domain-containing protein [Streptosporangiaceae bacterium]